MHCVFPKCSLRTLTQLFPPPILLRSPLLPSFCHHTHTQTGGEEKGWKYGREGGRGRRAEFKTQFGLKHLLLLLPTFCLLLLHLLLPLQKPSLLPFGGATLAAFLHLPNKNMASEYPYSRREGEGWRGFKFSSGCRAPKKCGPYRTFPSLSPAQISLAYHEKNFLEISFVIIFLKMVNSRFLFPRKVGSFLALALGFPIIPF